MVMDPARAEQIEPRSRRAILAGAIGGLAALVGSRFASPDAAKGAAGDPLIIGSTTNNAGTSNTTLTTNSTGTALLITQNGTGTALRGSAVGAGSIAGFFTANNGTGISGVTGNANSYGVFAQNNGAAAGTAGALRANGGQNHGVVASTANNGKYAVQATGANGTAIYGSAIQVGVEGSGYRGVKGTASASFASAGVWGQGGTGTDNYGVLGEANSASGRGVFGVNQAANGVGVYGRNQSAGIQFNAGNGVVGLSGGGDQSTLHPSGSIWDGAGEFVGSNGVLARTNQASGYGVAAWADTSGGIAIRGEAATGYAGYFVGLVHVTGNLSVGGTLTKGAGTFTIDHPLDPARKILSHSFVESPDMMNVYNGNVTTDANGKATVRLPDYFEALNKEPRYQLTAVGTFAQAIVSSKIKNNAFSIETDKPGVEVSWQVTGIRKDAYAEAHRIVVEANKPKEQQGLYLHPKEHGQPNSKGISQAQTRASGQLK